MLSRLTIENFKPLKNLRLQLSPLTILIGPNNAGKSSVLHLLAFLKQSLTSYPNFIGPYINLGDFNKAVHVGNTDLKVRAILEFKLEKSDQEMLLSLKKKGKSRISSGVLTLKKGLSLDKYDLSSVAYEIAIEYGGVSQQSLWDAKNQRLLRISLEKEANALKSSIEYFKSEKKFKAENAGLVAAWSSFAIPHDADPSLNDFVYWLRNIVINKLKSIYYLAAHRGIFDWSDTIGEYMPTEILPDGANTSNVLLHLSTNRKFRPIYDEITKWAHEFGLGHAVGSVRDNRTTSVEGIDPWLETPIDAAGTGVGINQLIPVIVQSFYASEQSLIMVEEPEEHLHPSRQVKLLDLFQDVMRQKKQLLVTTHSTEFLKRLHSRVKEKEIDPDMIQVYYLHREKGESRAESVNIQSQDFQKLLDPNKLVYS